MAKIYVNVNEQKVSDNENIVYDIGTDGIRCNSYFVLTDKRLYVNTAEPNALTESIIDLESVTYVKFIHPIKPVWLPFMILGLLLMVAGAVLIWQFFSMFYIGTLIAGLGLILLLIGVFKFFKRLFLSLEIGSSADTTTITFLDKKFDKVREIQKIILRTRDELLSKKYTN